jgi:hypothetical protein
MEYLKIENKGLLDMRLVYLMGGTTKDDDVYKIGEFGSGLKYTFAYLLRNNIMFKVFIDGKELKVTTKHENIRDKDFNIIYINGQQTSITTKMGKEWKAWMIVRELYANAMDEEGGSYNIVQEIKPEKGKTVFYIQNTGEIKNVVDNWKKYFIHELEPIQDDDEFAIYEGDNQSLKIYKNGFLIKEYENRKSVFNYDIKTAVINELREYNDVPSAEIREIMPKWNTNTIDIFLNNISDDYYEGTMDYSWSFSEKFGKNWKEAIGDAKIIDYKTYERLEDKHPEIKNEILKKIPTNLYKALRKDLPGISMLRASDKVNSFYESYSDKFNDKIKKCLTILESVGYFIDPELKVLTGVFGDFEKQGSINFDNKEIHLSQDLESLSDIELIYVLIEENEHYKTGFRDCSRNFQEHFIKLYTNILLKTNQKHP